VWVATLSLRHAGSYGDLVATFLIETYLSRERATEMEVQAARLVHAIAQIVAAAGPDRNVHLRHVRSYFVADDETCFHVIESPSADVVTELARRAGLTPDRVVEASSAG
jgi:hypothetical protein